MIAALPATPLRAVAGVTRDFLAAGRSDYGEAARHVWMLPYGRSRTRSRDDFRSVLAERRGTCSTKHALLAELAREQELPVRLVLCVFEMSEETTRGIGSVLDHHGLACVPEAHCLLEHAGQLVDLTFPGRRPSIPRLLHRETIAPDQIGDHKVALHRRYIESWIAERGLATDVETVWRAREDCIAALSGGGC